MGAVGFAALLANVVIALMLYRFRDSEANLRSAWICSRNDVLGNLGVLLAALGVFGSGTLWPDIIVAAIMATLAFQGSVTVVRQSLDELNRRQSLVVVLGDKIIWWATEHAWETFSSPSMPRG
jgi:Co/Zn/Cd efflux system component